MINFYLDDKTERFTFDDVLLIPQKSLKSRRLACPTADLESLVLKIPIMSANMSSVTEYDMAEAMYDNGGIGVLHRKGGVDPQVEWLKHLKRTGRDAFGSIGVNTSLSDFKKLRMSTSYICLDVANAYSEEVFTYAKSIKRCFPSTTLMVGNVCTAEGAKYLIDAGADLVKVGIGGGSACTTRLVTGHGFPQLSAISDCSYVTRSAGKFLVADGGLKEVGDVAKALAAGADCIMSGYLFAGCNESAGKVLSNGKREYAGMASSLGIVNENRLEGVVGSVVSTGSVKSVLNKVYSGLQSAMSYSNATNLKEFRKNARFVRVSSNVLLENYSRI